MAIAVNRVRVGALMCSVVSAALLSACSLGQSDGRSPDSGGAPTTQAGSGLNVTDPKDPGRLPPCDLLPAQGVELLGLVSPGRTTEGSFGSDEKDTCAWKSPDGAISASLGAMGDRTLQDYYANPSEFVDFEKLTIAGHPAVRANRGDPKADGTCSFFLASKSDQVVQATGQVPSTRRGQADPCDLAQRALESAVPSWPAAK